MPTYTGQSPILGQGQATAEQIQCWLEEGGKRAAPRFAPDSQYEPPPAATGLDIVTIAGQWRINHDLLAAQIAHESAYLQSAICRMKNNPSGLGATNDDPMDGAIEFATLRDGIKATAAHLMTYVDGNGPWREFDPRYEAVKAAGWLGVADVLNDLNGRWAWPGETYGDAIANLANDLLESEALMAGDQPGYEWFPSPNFGYPRSTHGRNGRTIDRLIIHTTEASYDSAFGHLRNPNVEASTHYLIDDDGGRTSQMVRESDAAWTAGNREYNERGINIEHVGYADQGGFSEAMLRESANLSAAIIKRHPAIKVDREHIIAHSEVPGATHHDPGPHWPWQQYLDMIRQELGPEPKKPDLGPRKFWNGYTIRGRIRDFWERAERENLAYQSYGLPTGDEYPVTRDKGTDTERKVVWQAFERAILEYDGAQKFPWDVSAVPRRLYPSDDALDVLEALDDVLVHLEAIANETKQAIKIIES